jgi:nucleotide-binding universal stress UspA family protein
MKSYKKILLASHGTEGAKEAEREAIELCAASGAHIHHLIVVPDFWKGMMGDDWLNNSSTRDDFGGYVESQLEEEIRSQVAQLTKIAEKKKIKYDYHVVVGKPGPAMLEATATGNFELAVIGSPRPKGKKGLRSRMDLDIIARDLPIPILIVPYPK